MRYELVNLEGYQYIKVSFSYADDKPEIDNILKKAFKMVGVVNPHGPDGALRTQDIRTNKLIGGLLAESAFLYYLKSRAKEKDVTLSILDSSFTQEEDISKLGFNQIDITFEVNGIKKEVEVRSSFSYKTSLQRLFGVPLKEGKGAFSIIGWYTSNNKSREVKKDYYVFAIHYYLPSEAQHRCLNEVEVYLAGAASRETLENEGAITSLGQQGARFVVINPLNSVPDPLTVIDELLVE